MLALWQPRLDWVPGAPAEEAVRLGSGRGATIPQAEPFVSSGGRKEAQGRAANSFPSSCRSPLAAPPRSRPGPAPAAERNPLSRGPRGKEKEVVRRSRGEPGSGREPVYLSQPRTFSPSADHSRGWRNRLFLRGHFDAPGLIRPRPWARLRLRPGRGAEPAELGLMSKVGESSDRGPELPKHPPSGPASL